MPSDTLELKSQAAVSHLMWVLGPESGPSARITSTLSHRIIFSPKLGSFGFHIYKSTVFYPSPILLSALSLHFIPISLFKIIYMCLSQLLIPGIIARQLSEKDVLWHNYLWTVWLCLHLSSFSCYTTSNFKSITPFPNLHCSILKTAEMMYEGFQRDRERKGERRKESYQF